VHYTDQGINGLVAAATHFALFQFDPSYHEQCEFFSFVGSGMIILNDMFFTILFISGCSLGLVIILQLIWWYLSHNNDYRVDKAAETLVDKLRMMYTVKDTINTIIYPHDSTNELSRRKFEQKHAKVMVRFGELKSSRGKDVGELAVGSPADVLSMRVGRAYA
jgi:hypothetical protein